MEPSLYIPAKLEENHVYGVASISRLLKMVGLFCRISSLLQGSFAEETYDFKKPTNRSHPIYQKGPMYMSKEIQINKLKGKMGAFTTQSLPNQKRPIHTAKETNIKVTHIYNKNLRGPYIRQKRPKYTLYVKRDQIYK